MKQLARLLTLVLALSVLMTSIINTASAEDGMFDEEVNLIWVQPVIDSIEFNIDAIMEEINKLTKEKINATITLVKIPFDEFTDRLNMMYTANERWDVTQGGFCNPIGTGVSMGAFAPIPRDTLEVYAPEYMTHFDSSVFDAVTYNGQIYACPIEQIWANEYELVFNEELTDKYQYDYTSVTGFDDLDDYLETILENEPDVVPFKTDPDSLNLLVYFFGWDCLVAPNVPGVVYTNSKDAEVINQFETEEFRSYLETMRRWYQAGYISADAATGGDSAMNKDFAVGTDVYVPGRRQMNYNLWGFYMNAVPISKSIALQTSKIQEHCQVISANCENIERAVAFINLLNTDEDILNLYIYGIPGVDWEYIDEERHIVKSLSAHYAYDFFVGNTLNTYPNDPDGFGAADEARSINANAEASTLLGFAFNVEPVSSQIALCSAICGEYLPGLLTGSVDYEVELANFNKALYDAGMQDIISEMQQQVDAWMFTK